MENKRLKRSHKNLFLLEAGFIFCKRRGIKYSDETFAEFFLSPDFKDKEDSEYDNICKDLRMYRYFDNYELKEITQEEYEACIEEFGYQEYVKN
jgi:hypothetical protein